VAVTYVNNWNNIMTAIKSKMRAEMKCPIFSGFDQINKSNQFIKLTSTGSSQLEKATFLEVREYSIDCQYFILRRNDAQFEKYLYNQVGILEALMHDNIVIDLADGTKAVDVTMGLMEFDVEVEDFEDYFVMQWELTCTHFGNAA
tara:strand:- start:2381 stop:2815 length:435 start_codon:yes stop_codon:yes gene_type:complete